MRSNHRLALALAATPLLFLGCDGADPADDAGPDLDAAPLDPATFTGTLTWEGLLLGYDASGPLEETCRATFDLTAVQVEDADCRRCPWVLELTSTMVESDCGEIDPVAVLQPDPELGPTRMYRRLSSTGDPIPVYVGRYDGDIFRGGLISGDLLGVGADNHFAIDGTELSWEYDYGPGIDQGLEQLVADCSEPTSGVMLDSDTSPGGGSTTDGEVSCLPGLVDVWELEAAAGSTVSVDVEMVDDATAFVPFLLVLDPDDCYGGDVLGGSTLCASGGSCVPSTIAMGTADRVRVVVDATCPDERADTTEGRAPYRLRVEGATATLVEHDLPRFAEYTVRTGHVTGSGTTDRPLE